MPVLLLFVHCKKRWRIATERKYKINSTGKLRRLNNNYQKEKKWVYNSNKMDWTGWKKKHAGQQKANPWHLILCNKRLGRREGNRVVSRCIYSHTMHAYIKKNCYPTIDQNWSTSRRPVQPNAKEGRYTYKTPFVEIPPRSWIEDSIETPCRVWRQLISRVKYKFTLLLLFERDIEKTSGTKCSVHDSWRTCVCVERPWTHGVPAECADINRRDSSSSTLRFPRLYTISSTWGLKNFALSLSLILKVAQESNELLLLNGPWERERPRNKLRKNTLQTLSLTHTQSF